MTVFLIVVLLVISLAAVMFFSLIFWGLRFATPWIPLLNKCLLRSLELAELKPNDYLYDLGSGDGRIVIEAARRYGVRARGIELVWWLCLYSRLRIRKLGLEKLVTIKCDDALKEEYSDATVVICYLMPEFLDRLGPKLKEQLKPGSRVISACFKIKDLNLVKVDQPTLKDKPIYIYQI